MFRQKPSRYVLFNQAKNFIDGVVFARQQGTPLGHCLNFNCDLLGVQSDSFIKHFTKLASDWLRPQGIPPTWNYMRENPGDNKPNVHLTMHIPPGVRKEFVSRQTSWALTASGRSRLRPKSVVTRYVGIERGQPFRIITDDEYVDHAEVWFRYLLKGAEEWICDDLNMAHHPQGEVIGRRLGMSENISAKARNAAGFAMSRRSAVMFRDRASWDQLAIYRDVSIFRRSDLSP
jgi:hypothetical protein